MWLCDVATLNLLQATSVPPLGMAVVLGDKMGLGAASLVDMRYSALLQVS